MKEQILAEFRGRKAHEDIRADFWEDTKQLFSRRSYKEHVNCRKYASWDFDCTCKHIPEKKPAP